MSHELRTPLNAIIGFSEIMEAAMFGPLGADKYREYSRDIRESGQYLLDVINDILDMSKIEAGGIRLAAEDVELEPILADSLRVVSGRAGDKRLALTSHVTPGIRLKADRRALKQIALNLLSNAVKFTPDGGAVTVRGRRARRHGHYRHRGQRHRHSEGRAAQARPAVRAGRKPIDQAASGLRAGARHRQIADRDARRRACAFARRSEGHDGAVRLPLEARPPVRTPDRAAA